MVTTLVARMLVCRTMHGHGLNTRRSTHARACQHADGSDCARPVMQTPVAMPSGGRGAWRETGDRRRQPLSQFGKY